MEKKEKIAAGAALFATVMAGTLHFAGANVVLTFGTTAAALALLAVIVGDATKQLGSIPRASQKTVPPPCFTALRPQSVVVLRTNAGSRPVPVSFGTPGQSRKMVFTARHT